MSDGEILYDDVAMENVHSLLVAANNKLMLAKEYYNSDKLSGRALINDVESFMDEIAPYLSSYSHASDGIYEGKSLEFDFSENIDGASFYSSREEIMGGMYVESSTSNILDTSLGDSDSPYQVPEKNLLQLEKKLWEKYM